MALLRINLLGSFELLAADGRPLALPGRTLKLLLAYLAAVPGRAVARGELAGLLWGERGEEQARGSLRQALLTLRRALGPAAAALGTTREAVALDPALVTVDLAELERQSGAGGLEALERAAALCRGELLAGLEATTAEAEDWLLQQRQAALERCRRTLLQLARRQAERGDAEAAEATAERLIALDPAEEEAHRLLIGLHAKAGRWPRAARQYEACARSLRTLLGVEPAAETRALYAQALQRQAAAPQAPAVREPEERPLPAGRPAVAVLPFENLTGDAGKDYLADGMTEELIAELARVPELSVIARQAAFAYRGRPVPAERIAAELGVGHLLFGAVRLSGARARVTVQLVEAAGGRVLWSERYDRVPGDLLALQEAIAREVTVALQVALIEGDAARRWNAGTQDLEAWRLYTRAQGEMRRYCEPGYRAAAALAAAATVRDPGYALAWTLAAEVGLTRVWDGQVPAAGRRDAFAAAEAALARAFALAPELPEAWVAQSLLLLLERRHAAALAAAERALAAAPGDANGLLMLAICRICDGEMQRGLAAVRAALRLTPLHPPTYRHWLARGLLGTGRPAEALAAADACVAEWPDYPSGHIVRAWAAAEAGDRGRAEAAARALLALDPGFSVARNAAMELYRDPALTARQRRALLLAGLPE